MSNSTSLNITIDENAKCTHGHFPGNPIVPGAYLLSTVAHHCEKEFAVQLENVAKVKFVRPLKPGEHAVLSMTKTNNLLKFTIKVGDESVMSGKGDTT